MHYVIIGNGVAGIEAAFTLRERFDPSEADITVISKETDYFYSRTALMYAFMDMMERKDLEPFERGFYDKQKIRLVRDTVTDLDADAKKLTLEGAGEMPYDKLLLAVGAKPRAIPFKGIEKVEEGIVNFVSMQDLEECERLAMQSERAVVVGGGLIGIELVECLNFHGLHTTFLVREPHYWPVALASEEGEIVSAHIRHHGVDLRHEEELDEILSDDHGKLTGVRTKRHVGGGEYEPGEEIPCEILGLCIGVVANVDFLKASTTPPEVKRGICVNDSFETTLEDVYAAGDCAQIDISADHHVIETIWYSAKRHGRLAALSMMGDEVHYRPPLFYNSSKFFEIEYTTVGDVIRVPEHAKAIFRTMPGKEITQRIVYDPTEGDRVIGFNMLGSRWNHRLFERWILERRSIEYTLRHLHEAQFDVEFGRVPIERFQETEVNP